MYNSGTLSCPFPQIKIPTCKKVLTTILTFEVNLTDVVDFFEIKVRMCINGSKMIQRLDFTVLYAPTVDANLFKLSIGIAASEKNDTDTH